MDSSSNTTRLAEELGIPQEKLISIDNETTLILLNKLKTSKLTSVDLLTNDIPNVDPNLKKNLIDKNKIISKLKDQYIELSTNVQILEEENASNRCELMRKAEEASLLNSHKVWMESQIRKDTEEFITYKETKQNELSDMNRKVVDVLDQNKLLLSIQKELRSKNSELSSIVETTSKELKSAKDILKLKESEFTKEMNATEKMKELLTEQLRNFELQAKNNIESSSNSIDSHERDRLINEIALTKDNLKEYKQKCAHLQTMIDSFITNGGGNFDSTSLNHNQPLNINYLNEEIDSLKRQLLQDRQQKEHLQRQLETMIAEMETKMPLIESFKKRTEELEHQLLDTSDLLEKVSHEKTEMSRDLRIIKKKQDDRADNMKLLRIQRNDLARQVQFLLAANTHIEDGSTLFSSDELTLVKKIISNENENDYSDSQKVISTRLVCFKNTQELQQKNMDLLNSIRGLAKQLELMENANVSNDNQNTIKEAKLAMIDLQNHANDLQDNVDTLTKERNSLRLLIPQGNKVHNLTKKKNSSINSDESTAEELFHLNEKLENMELKKNEKISELNSIIEKQTVSIHQLKLELEKANSSNSLLQSHVNDLNHEVNDMSGSRNSIKEELEKAQSTIMQFKTNEYGNGNQINELTNQLSSQKLLQDKIEARSNQMAVERSSIQEKYIKTCEEKNELKVQLGDLEIKLKTLEDTYTASIDQCNTLKREIELLLGQANDQQKMLHDLEEKRRTEIQWFQDESISINKKYIDAETTISKITRENEDQKQKQIMLNIELQSLKSTQDNNGTLHYNEDVLNSEADQPIIEPSKELNNGFSDGTQKDMVNDGPNILELEAKIRELVLSLSVMKDQNSSLKKRLIETQTMLEKNSSEDTHTPDTFKHIKSDELQATSTDGQDSIISHFEENINILEKQLSFANEKFEGLSTQNDLLLEKLHKMESITDNPSIDDILVCLKHERDNLRKRVDILEREMRTKANASSHLHSTELRMSTSQPNAIAESHNELVNKIHEFNIIQQKNEELETQLKNLNDEKNANNDEIDQLKGQLEPYKTTVNELKKTILEKEQNVKLLQEESSRWKTQSMRLSSEPKSDPNEVLELKEQINALNANISAKDLQSKDMDEKFARLKKQAHERLDSTKLVVNQLNDEINILKSEKDALQHALDDKVSECDGMNLKIEELKNTEGSSRSQSSEPKLSHDYDPKEQIIELEKEITYLKGKLELFDESAKSPDLINYLEKLDNIKKQFEEARVEEQIIHQSDINPDLVGMGSSLNVDKNLLDKEKEKWEIETLKRIKDAKEDLKRHLRQPTEEKINRVIEKRKRELQDNFDELALEKAKSLILSNEINLTAAQVKEELRQRVETEMQENLEQSRKKIFEEGRQQELMKTKLLERKLSKLEDSQNITTESPSREQGNKGESDQQNNASIQLGISANFPNFGLPTAATNNPFTFSAQSSNSSLGTFQTQITPSPFVSNKNTNFAPIFGKPSTSFGIKDYRAPEIQDVDNTTKSSSETANKVYFDNSKTTSSSDSHETVERPFKRSKTEEP
ncbi:similar to Saccharomyces cerevisiae YIL149C MLP2 Myosin-like protein associated with the nuclear envelope, connects the nuclear pore complex with the nuclear interior [Maudiozyma saulgeensis]|uniref:Similar to Saccharomyces cerevisiae YIL149C MLP2 Myosin-like protein associated with the nuclear envelope, connects the nuclear pore complex with the nuclear interior n=1 Tax=Maudiozyma saulgeensis TaxID=1789683 RepID=A0A1X7QWX1_9SACH|nr:similar to Saccharomyces cerevisiae YIL149C MLP2 Myosin-like protein associated with the nuclear envelope, connects the nuclear pore complex with the nuclear interior [Kazachstania saulgeensis]